MALHSCAFNLYTICLAIGVLTLTVQARILSRCELARELHKLGVPREELPIWTCIARFESKYDTSAIGRLNGNWSNDFGLFQISDRYWCVSSPKRSSANLCQLNCQQLLSDDIRVAVSCARTVQRLQGWQAWAVYRRCSGSAALEDVQQCF